MTSSGYTADGGDFTGAEECRACAGSGSVWVSAKGVLAQYPGGPFLGRTSSAECDQGGHRRNKLATLAKGPMSRFCNSSSFGKIAKLANSPSLATFLELALFHLLAVGSRWRPFFLLSGRG
jgi:hypothetical protein